MIRKVNVCAVGQIQSGTSQSTGNQWRKQEFVVEWYESPSDTQSQKIVLSVMNDNIDKLKVQVGDKMEIRFDLRSREYNGRYYQDVYAPFDAIKKIGGLTDHPEQTNAPQGTTAAPQQPQQQAPAYNHQIQAPFPPQVDTQGNPITNQGGKPDDLPF